MEPRGEHLLRPTVRGLLQLTVFALTYKWVHSVGVGLSYGEHVGTTEDAAKDVYAFITMFFATFSQYKGRAPHLAAESYGVSSPNACASNKRSSDGLPRPISACVCQRDLRPKPHRGKGGSRGHQPAEYLDQHWSD